MLHKKKKKIVEELNNLIKALGEKPFEANVAPVFFLQEFNYRDAIR
jgi:hypothetical protein